ncbi:hypothetical protein DM01DRAFT_328262 [Hesseltinella vesiculosa]|uniref:Uncharacterized protein n=1 Tax=Hesseltinella vesiculosa TaxID=101127 RepID=A0A1X2GF60_9FUNG|nr:hypothetical protein DM01DRAFT_328262 [Hesseltinella vesiculosa]
MEEAATMELDSGEVTVKQPANVEPIDEEPMNEEPTIEQPADDELITQDDTTIEEQPRQMDKGLTEQQKVDLTLQPDDQYPMDQVDLGNGKEDTQVDEGENQTLSTEDQDGMLVDKLDDAQLEQFGTPSAWDGLSDAIGTPSAFDELDLATTPGATKLAGLDEQSADLEDFSTPPQITLDSLEEPLTGESEGKAEDDIMTDMGTETQPELHSDPVNAANSEQPGNDEERAEATPDQTMELADQHDTDFADVQDITEQQLDAEPLAQEAVAISKELEQHESPALPADDHTQDDLLMLELEQDDILEFQQDDDLAAVEKKDDLSAVAEQENDPLDALLDGDELNGDEVESMDIDKTAAPDAPVTHDDIALSTSQPNQDTLAVAASALDTIKDTDTATVTTTAQHEKPDGEQVDADMMLVDDDDLQEMDAADSLAAEKVATEAIDPLQDIDNVSNDDDLIHNDTKNDEDTPPPAHVPLTEDSLDSAHSIPPASDASSTAAEADNNNLDTPADVSPVKEDVTQDADRSPQDASNIIDEEILDYDEIMDMDHAADPINTPTLLELDEELETTDDILMTHPDEPATGEATDDNDLIFLDQEGNDESTSPINATESNAVLSVADSATNDTFDMDTANASVALADEAPHIEDTLAEGVKMDEDIAQNEDALSEAAGVDEAAIESAKPHAEVQENLDDEAQDIPNEADPADISEAEVQELEHSLEVPVQVEEIEEDLPSTAINDGPVVQTPQDEELLHSPAKSVAISIEQAEADQAS